MGYFKNAFDISSGATLGYVATMTGVQIGSAGMTLAMNGNYAKYRAQYFDPVVRQDLNDLLVFGKLQNIAYPFPSGSAKKQNFITRHKVFSVTVVVFLALMLLNGFAGFKSGPLFDLMMAVVCWFWIVLIGMLLSKAGKLGKKGLDFVSNNRELDNFAQHYWHIREYVRQVLDSGQMDVKTAITKLCNTELVQHFPDTVDEIEANAFYYRQQKGLA